MYYGEEAIKQIKNIVYEDAFIEETESVNEAWFFISKEAKELKQKIKDIIKVEFEPFRSKGFGEKLKGAFTGANSSQLTSAYRKALDKITRLLDGGKAFGPNQRTRTYTVGNTTVTETYYVYDVYGYCKGNLIKVEYECGTSSFALHEYKCKIPEKFVKDVIRTSSDRLDMYINANSIAAREPNSFVKSKRFAMDLIGKAEKAGLSTKLDFFGTTVKF